jgi:hypothetical protein
MKNVEYKLECEILTTFSKHFTWFLSGPPFLVVKCF